MRASRAGMHWWWGWRWKRWRKRWCYSKQSDHGKPKWHFFLFLYFVLFFLQRTITTMIFLFLQLSLAGHFVPLFLSKGIRSGVPSERILFSWKDVEDSRMIPCLLQRHFGARENATRCEIFMMDGIPAASFVYDSKDRYGKPIITRFHVNKERVVVWFWCR